MQALVGKAPADAQTGLLLRKEKTMKEFLEACQAIVDYMWDDEEKNWEACGKPDSHIFVSLKVVHNFLNQVYQWVDER